MTEAPLQYHIDFPDPNFNYRNENQTGDDEEIIEIKDAAKVPLVVLFGWAGSADRYVRVYSKIYEDKGLITLRHICPVKIIFWEHHYMTGIAKKLVKLVKEQNLEDRPMILHAFSNGGSFQYEHFMKALVDNDMEKQVKGVIFDSTPGRRTVSNLFAAVHAMRKGTSSILSYTVTYLIATFLLACYGLRSLKGIILRRKVYVLDPVLNIKDEPNYCPQHFIYSKVDEMIPPEDVEYFMDIRKSKGVEVSSKKYDNTLHVRHYQQDKPGYRKSVYQFVNYCLRK